MLKTADEIRSEARALVDAATTLFVQVEACADEVEAIKVLVDALLRERIDARDAALTDIEQALRARLRQSPLLPSC